MKLMRHWLLIAGMASVMTLGTHQLCAQAQAQAQDKQDNSATGERNRDRGDRSARANGAFDPAQFRERMMERLRENLEVKEDADWKAIQPLVQKVMDARMAMFSGMGRGMVFGGRGRGQGGDDNGGGRGGRGGFPGQEPSPDLENLQKAIDSKASNAEMKAALAKYAAYRKAKQAELEKAQGELRSVLTVRQEALATLNGLL